MIDVGISLPTTNPQVSYLLEAKASPEYVFDVEKMEAAFKQQYDGCMFTIGQPLIFSFDRKNLLVQTKKLALVELMSFEKAPKGPGAREGDYPHMLLCPGLTRCRTNGRTSRTSDRNPIWQIRRQRH